MKLDALVPSILFSELTYSITLRERTKNIISFF
jgi:hypothetical protein